VTIDKDSRKILSLIRDWNENDEDARRKRLYVKYPYVPGPGFYGTGLMQILGNSTAALTTAWRMTLDTGMFANFPAGLAEKSTLRQLNNIMRAGPGEFVPIDTGGKDIRTLVMPFPFKDVTGGILQLIELITAQVKQLGGAADIPAAEGLQNVPVGTMLSQIEQTTKIMAAAHKGMHTAQAEEFALLLDLFKENPQDFWRGNGVAPHGYWTDEKFLAALEKCPPLVPASDPNVPSHIHRIARVIALLQVAANPLFQGRWNVDELQRIAIQTLKFAPTTLMQAPPPQGAAPDPAMIAAQARADSAQAQVLTAQARAAESQQKMQMEPEKLQLQRDTATTDLAREMIIHGKDQAEMAHAAQSQSHDQQMDRAAHGLDVLRAVHDIGTASRQHGMDAADMAHQHTMDRASHALDVHEAMKPEPKTATKRARGGRVRPKGARKARDGRYYLPDPERPGKYLLIADA
jgi:hypothetical protein